MFFIFIVIGVKGSLKSSGILMGRVVVFLLKSKMLKKKPNPFNDSFHNSLPQVRNWQSVLLPDRLIKF